MKAILKQYKQFKSVPMLHAIHTYLYSNTLQQ